MGQPSITGRSSRGFALAPRAPLVLCVLASCAGEPSSARDGGGAGSAGSGTAGSGATGAAGASGSIGSGGAPGGDSAGQATGGGGAIVDPACPGDEANAYRGMPAAIPGTVEAEDFDPVGYSDATMGNEGQAYRTDVDADIKELGAGYALGWLTTGEWVEYTVDVAAGGDYRIELRVGAVEAGRTLEISKCGTPLTEAVAVPQIADWGEIEVTTAGPVYLPAGLQVIRFTVGLSDFLDFDSVTFDPVTGGAGGSGAGGNGGSGGAPPKFVGNITTGYNSAVDTNGRIFSAYWDQITPENAGKWGSVQPTASSGFNWSALDAIYDYAREKGITFKQHTFVWGSQQPSGALGESQVKAWMQEFCARYPETRLIDVVNEPPPHTEPSYASAIGGGTNGSWQWIVNSFTWAREACPDAILILNDYNNVEYADQNQHFIDIANVVKDAGAPIDALGAQAHGLSGNISAATMQDLLTKMHEDTGLPVYITEYDIDLADDAEQLTKYQQHVPFFLETEWIHGVTIWGWIHGSTWVPDSGLIKNGTPRSAMTWLMQELGRPAP